MRCGRRSPTTCALPRTPAGRSWGSARACSPRSAASTSTPRTTARHLSRAGAVDGNARVAALAFRVTQPELTTASARALGATHVVSEATTQPRGVVGEPRLQRRAAREAARRRDREAGRHVLLQRGGRQAHRGARLQGGPGDRERRARAVDRRRRLPGGHHGLRRGLPRRLQGHASRQPLVLHLALPARARRDRRRLGPRFHVRERHRQRDRDQGDRDAGDDDGVLPLAPARPGTSRTRRRSRSTT